MTNSPDRRSVLRGVAAAGTLAASGSLLAACGGDDDDAGTTTSTTPAPTTSSAPESSAAETSTSASPSGESPAVGGAALAATSEIPVGGGKIFKDQGVVITQPTAGTFKGFSNICTHQRCPLTSVEGGSITCQCHGSKFSITDGSVQSPPAQKPLGSVAISVVGDQITKA